MKLFVLEKFDKNELKHVSEFINKYDELEHIHFFLNSEGGDTIVGDALTTLINTNPGKFSISVLTACSSAFLLILNVHCKIRLLRNGYAMAHKGGWQIFMRDGYKSHGEFSEFQKKQLEAFEDYQELDYLTEKEAEDYSSGKDIYLGYDRLKKIMGQSGKEYYEEGDYYLIKGPGEIY